MVENAAVANAPQSAIEESKQKREQSKIDFPYTALDLAITLAKAVHDLGNQCDWAQLAAKLDMAADGGGFRQRLQAGKLFGLISYTSRTITLTPLGIQINDPDQLSAAKIEAFLNVPLYKAVYEQFRTGLLPGADGLENAMVVLGVAQKQKDKARQAFQRSATEAGFFGYAPNRLVMPTVKQGKKTDTPLPEKPNPNSGNGGTENGGNGGGGGNKRHPLIEGLLETLPPAAVGTPKAEWSVQNRLEWLQTASGIFSLIYKAAADDRGGVKVTLDMPRDSAN